MKHHPSSYFDILVGIGLAVFFLIFCFSLVP